MIIACPACGTRYAVPESAIGTEGRTVRCAKCKHSWFQETQLAEIAPDALSRPAPAPPPAPIAPVSSAPKPSTPPPPAEQEAAPAPSIDHWRSEDAPAGTSLPPEDETASLALRALRSGRRAAEETGGGDPAASPNLRAPLRSNDPVQPPALDSVRYDDFDEDKDAEFSQFGYRAPFTHRRNTAKWWTLAAAIFAAMAIATIAAVNYYGVPEWAPFSRPTFGMGKPGLELDFPPEQNRSEVLDSGEAIFRVRGTIGNSARETLAVPNLLIVFRDQRDRQVANWVIAPTKRELAPGESLNVTEAIADVPPAAVFAEIGWAL